MCITYFSTATTTTLFHGLAPCRRPLRQIGCQPCLGQLTWAANARHGRTCWRGTWTTPSSTTWTDMAVLMWGGRGGWKLRECIERQRLVVWVPYGWLWFKTVLGSHFGVFGEFTTHFRTYLSRDWDVHWGYDLRFDPWPHGGPKPRLAL